MVKAHLIDKVDAVRVDYLCFLTTATLQNYDPKKMVKADEFGGAWGCLAIIIYSHFIVIMIKYNEDLCYSVTLPASI